MARTSINLLINLRPTHLCAHVAVAIGTASLAAYPFEFCDDLYGDGNYKTPYAERIETERHDFTQSATTVGRGVVQIEAGYTFFYHDQDGEIETAHTGPESMFRFGLSDDIEFRLRWDYAWVAIDGEVEESGAEDLRWSFKLQITEQEECSCRPTSALEINSSVPTGGEDWTTGRVGIGLDYIYQWEVAEGTTVAGSTGFATDGFADFGFLPEDQAADKSLAMSQSAVVGFELTEASTMYVEWFGIYSHGMGGRDRGERRQHRRRLLRVEQLRPRRPRRQRAQRRRRRLLLRHRRRIPVLEKPSAISCQPPVNDK